VKSAIVVWFSHPRGRNLYADRQCKRRARLPERMKGGARPTPLCSRRVRRATRSLAIMRLYWKNFQIAEADANGT
jgi:hypothetical protein